MSAELKDFRGKITAEGDCALEAVSRATGKDRAEIVRELVHEWALKQIHAASVMHRLMQSEGLGGIAEGPAGSAGGIAGNRRESRGTRGSAGE
jgi:hypothetical protein